MLVECSSALVMHSGIPAIASIAVVGALALEGLLVVHGDNGGAYAFGGLGLVAWAPHVFRSRQSVRCIRVLTWSIGLLAGQACNASLGARPTRIKQCTDSSLRLCIATGPPPPVGWAARGVATDSCHPPENNMPKYITDDSQLDIGASCSCLVEHTACLRLVGRSASCRGGGVFPRAPSARGRAPNTKSSG